jgi:hypothetical protein
MRPEQEWHFVRLALEAGWIDEQRLRQAEADRASRPDTPLPELLVERGWLSREQREELQTRLAEPSREGAPRSAPGRRSRPALRGVASAAVTCWTWSTRRSRAGWAGSGGRTTSWSAPWR